MTKSSRRGSRLVALFLLGCLLFNYPLLMLFNVIGGLVIVPAWMKVIQPRFLTDRRKSPPAAAPAQHAVG